MRELRLSLLVILVVSDGSPVYANRAGLIQFKKTGQFELVKEYIEDDSKVSYQTCKGATGKTQLEDIEFIDQPDACAKMSLEYFGQFLDRVKAVVSTSNGVQKISIEIPPNLDFQAAKAQANTKIANSITKRGPQLKVTITGVLSKDATGFHFVGTTSKKKWVDESNMILIQHPEER